LARIGSDVTAGITCLANGIAPPLSGRFNAGLKIDGPLATLLQSYISCPASERGS